MSSLVSDLSPVEARVLLDAETPLVLDVRDPHSYRDGHIRDAMLYHDDLLRTLIGRAEFDRAVLVYCYQGKSSLGKAQLLASAGFRRVYNLAGGYVAWKKAAEEPVGA